MINFDSSVGVMQREWGVTSSNSEKPVLFTYEFSACYTATFYSRLLKVGVLTHIDDSTNLTSVDQIFDFFKENYSISSQELEANLVGGWKDHSESKKWGENLLSLLKKKRVQMKICRLFEKKFANISVFMSKPLSQRTLFQWSYAGLDTRTGEFLLSDQFHIEDSRFPDYSTRFQRIISVDGVSEYPLKKIVDKRSYFYLTFTAEFIADKVINEYV